MTELLVAMPRETNTSLFKSQVTLFLFLTVCLIGLTFVLLIFFQNYKNWKERKTKNYADKQTQLEAEKAANHDFFNSILVCVVILAVFVFLIVAAGMGLLS